MLWFSQQLIGTVSTGNPRFAIGATVPSPLADLVSCCSCCVLFAYEWNVLKLCQARGNRWV